MDKLKAFESFVSVATKGSLTAAAKAEGVAPAIMGRRLDALEEHLGVKLMVRTTRRISLTHEGSAFLEDCQRLLADVANAEASVSAGGVKATGHLRITANFHGEKFFVRQNGLLWATPMFLVLLLIEASDVIFAVDSIPAIFAVTTDPFIVFTSNIFAIMGLRALYFLLADMADRFHLLKYGLAIVLIFIGGKMLAAPWFHIPIQWSLSIVGAIILISVILSLTLSQKDDTPQGDAS